MKMKIGFTLETLEKISNSPHINKGSIAMAMSKVFVTRPDVASSAIDLQRPVNGVSNFIKN